MVGSEVVGAEAVHSVSILSFFFSLGVLYLMKRLCHKFGFHFVFVRNAELGARAVCSILLGMNVLDAKAPCFFVVFMSREQCTGCTGCYSLSFSSSLQLESS